MKRTKDSIKALGKINPYSGQYFSELLGISYEYFRRLEWLDKRKHISLKFVLKVMILLDCTLEELLK